jgi:hypothetical protein
MRITAALPIHRYKTHFSGYNGTGTGEYRSGKPKY